MDSIQFVIPPPRHTPQRLLTLLLTTESATAANSPVFIFYQCQRQHLRHLACYLQRWIIYSSCRRMSRKIFRRSSYCYCSPFWYHDGQCDYFKLLWCMVDYCLFGLHALSFFGLEGTKALALSLCSLPELELQDSWSIQRTLATKVWLYLQPYYFFWHGLKNPAALWIFSELSRSHTKPSSLFPAVQIWASWSLISLLATVCAWSPSSRSSE